MKENEDVKFSHEWTLWMLFAIFDKNKDRDVRNCKKEQVKVKTFCSLRQLVDLCLKNE